MAVLFVWFGVKANEQIDELVVIAQLSTWPNPNLSLSLNKKL